MEYVVEPSPRPALPVRGARGRFPVNRVWCVGKNYADHAREMGESGRNPPVFFDKSAEALHPSDRFPYPPMSADVHHEIELAVALGGGGRDIAASEARGLIWGYAVALDMTRRDLQAQARASGQPWDMAKNFDAAAPIGPLSPAATLGHPRSGAIRLSVNGQPRQSGDLAEMIWSPEEVIAELSRHVTLAAGDLILTGTPAGVGPVRPGDVMEGFIEHLGALRVVVD